MIPIALTPPNTFDTLASESQIERTALTLEANAVHTLIVQRIEQARKLFFELVHEGSQRYQSALWVRAHY
jgi:hypothetical protein